MTQSVAELSARIALRSGELRDRIGVLMDRQDDLQDDILMLQRNKRQGQAIDAALLRKLKASRREASRMVGKLALERTELLDDLPVIRLATGKIRVIAEELEEDSALIEETAEKLRKVTESLANAEKLLVKIIGLVSLV